MHKRIFLILYLQGESKRFSINTDASTYHIRCSIVRPETTEFELLLDSRRARWSQWKETTVPRNAKHRRASVASSSCIRTYETTPHDLHWSPSLQYKIKLEGPTEHWSPYRSRFLDLDFIVEYKKEGGNEIAKLNSDLPMFGYWKIDVDTKETVFICNEQRVKVSVRSDNVDTSTGNEDDWKTESVISHTAFQVSFGKMTGKFSLSECLR